VLGERRRLGGRGDERKKERERDEEREEQTKKAICVKI
jgi:hypothetical protein